MVGSVLLYPEARAAVARAQRGRRLRPRRAARAVTKLEILICDVTLVEPDEGLARHAGELAALHGLQGCDAVHLASALHERHDVLVTSDEALAAAARAEGLRVVVPAA